MYILYSCLLFFSLCVYFPVYFIRFRLLKKESLYLKERMGFLTPDRAPQDKSLWIHAVSVGEVLSLRNLISTAKQRHPDWAIYFSTLTSTGLRIATEKLKEADRIFFVPLDFKCIAQKFFCALEPTVFIMAESEFWPNLIRTAKKMTKNVLLVNGRISARSYRRFRKVKKLMRKILAGIDLFLVQTEEDKRKLEDIGVNAGFIEVAGNLKSDIELPVLSQDDVVKLKQSINLSNRKKVIIAGSVRKGEEEQLLNSYAKARIRASDLVLIIAPRHPERAGEVEKICQKYSLSASRRTELVKGEIWDVLILDTLGELPQFYALSDIAFVGGSLVPWGGHNLLEPAFYCKPIFFGPHMHNFSFLAERFVASGGAQIVEGEEDLLNMFLFDDETHLLEMGNRARKTLDELRGATERTIERIESIMERA